MRLIVSILALFSYSAISPVIASPAVISFDASITPDVTYNVHLDAEKGAQGVWKRNYIVKTPDTAYGSYQN